MKKSYLFAVIASGVFATGCNGGGSNNTPPVNGLTTSFNDGNNSFNATTETPSVTKIMTLSNTGESNISRISFILPSNNYFSVTQDSTGLSPCVVENQSITNTLLPNNDCTIKITYNNATVTPSSSANIEFNYSYAMESKNQTTPVIYTTTSNVVPSNKVKYVLGQSEGYILYSKDGVSWTQKFIAPQGSSEDIISVLYANGLWVVGGTNGNVYTSTDGITWSAPILINSDKQFIRSITYGGGKFVAVSGNKAITSTDGMTWNLPINMSSRDFGYFNSITYGNGSFVAVGKQQNVCNSVDAISWSCVSIPPYYNDLMSITFGDGVFVAVGATASGTNNISYSSTDGVNWSPSTLSSSDTLSLGVAYGNKKFVAAQENNTTYTSNNAINWQGYNLPVGFYNLTPYNSVTFDGSKFWVIGAYGVATSVDSQTWTYSQISAANYKYLRTLGVRY